MYTVPRKIEDIVRNNEDEMRRRIATDKETSIETLTGGTCHLLGYEAETKVISAAISPWEAESNMDSRKSNVDGCSVLRDNCCYLRKGTRKHPLAEYKEDCLVYRRVVELCQGPKLS